MAVDPDPWDLACPSPAISIGASSSLPAAASMAFDQLPGCALPCGKGTLKEGT
jgi:hypothetical protein